MTSKMYCFNYKFLEVMSDCIKSHETNGGYRPNRKHIRQEVIDVDPTETKHEISEVSVVKMECLKSLITEAKEYGVSVVLVSSPYWKGYPEVDLSVVKKLSVQMGVPFIDYKDSDIRNNPDWFADSMHLNDDGAQEFSKDIADKLKSIISRI